MMMTSDDDDDKDEDDNHGGGSGGSGNGSVNDASHNDEKRQLHPAFWALQYNWSTACPILHIPLQTLNPANLQSFTQRYHCTFYNNEFVRCDIRRGISPAP
jgi:hypothetical protein